VGDKKGKRISLRKEAESSNDLPKIQEVREAAIADAEKKYLLDLMAITSRDIKQACKISGLSRSRLYTLLKKHKISTSR
jgi:two-component system NtrC family response regulator